MEGRFHIAISRPEDIIPRLGKGILHWRAGRSAGELATSWWSAKGIPRTVRSVIGRCAEWRDAEIVDADAQADSLDLFENGPGMGRVVQESVFGQFDA